MLWRGVLADNPASVEEMRARFAGPPTGRLVPPSLQAALDRIAALERRVAELEGRAAARQREGAAPPPRQDGNLRGQP